MVIERFNLSADATFTCDVLPAIAGGTIQSITVDVDVFSKSFLLAPTLLIFSNLLDC